MSAQRDDVGNEKSRGDGGQTLKTLDARSKNRPVAIGNLQVYANIPSGWTRFLFLQKLF